MIIRKPYAFLIKHFKLIHIGIFIIFGYLLLSIRDLYKFFKGVIINNNYSGGMGLENKYTSFLLIISIIILILLAFSIYFLMKKKNKPIRFYQLIMGYCAILLVFLFIYRSYFVGVGSEIYSSRTLVLYRDSSLILYVITYAFVGFSFVRAFGFDIKKFSFDKDRKELNITSSDNEEVELNLNLDKDKIVNSIRRERRQFKNFIEDNIVIIKKIGMVIAGVLVIYIAINLLVTNKVYNMNDWIPVRYLDSAIKVNRVYLTNLDAYQDSYSSKYKYVGVIFDIKVGNYNIAYGNSMIRVMINGKDYYPIQNSASILSDMGSFCKSGTKLLPNKEYKNLVVLFEYDKDINIRNLSIEMYMDDGKYHKINSDYVEQGNTKRGYQNIDFKYGEEIPILGGITIDSYQIHKNTVTYKLPDNSCGKEECPLYTKRIQPNINEYIMEVNLKYNDTPESIKYLEYYISILYEKNNKMRLNNAKTLKILDHVTIDGVQKLYLSVHSDVLDSNNKYLVFTTRDAKYQLLLGSETKDDDASTSQNDEKTKSDNITNNGLGE